MLEAPEAADDDEAGPVGSPETVIPARSASRQATAGSWARCWLIVPNRSQLVGPRMGSQAIRL